MLFMLSLIMLLGVCCLVRGEDVVEDMDEDEDEGGEDEFIREDIACGWK